MTKSELHDKWTARGKDAACDDMWMRPCYADDLDEGIESEDLLAHGREQWESTDHFQACYGSIMYHDALVFLVSLGELGKYPDPEAVIELKMDLLEAFWEAWEDEVGAHDLIEQALENRPKALASKMLDLLYVEASDCTVYFAASAATEHSQEYQELCRWMSHQYMERDFVFDQVYYALDSIANDGLENIEPPEPDVYTQDLVDWLAADIRHLTYVTEALQCQHTEAFRLLQAAQAIAIDALWLSLADMLRDLLLQ